MPRPLPVMLIHGFNGDPGDWTDSGFRQYLLSHGDLEPDLVRLFRYGLAEDGTYNNRGDIRQIASRLAGVGLTAEEMLSCSVDQLSQDSVARGGPAPVTLIAHSMGGIISRYYLSCTAPDGFGAAYQGHVGRLIQIASPNRGVELAKIASLIPRGSLGWRLLRFLEKLGLAPALPAEAIEAWEADLTARQIEERATIAPEMAGEEGRVLLSETPVYSQLRPDSPLLAALNAPGTMPEHVGCHTFYGDIRVRVRVTLGAGGLALLDHAVSFGDLAVPAASAMEIPYVPATQHPYVTEKCIELTLRVAPAEAETRSLAALLPDTSHARLLSNPAVQDGVLAVLG